MDGLAAKPASIGATASGPRPRRPPSILPLIRSGNGSRRRHRPTKARREDLPMPRSQDKKTARIPRSGYFRLDRQRLRWCSRRDKVTDGDVSLAEPPISALLVEAERLREENEGLKRRLCAAPAAGSTNERRRTGRGSDPARSGVQDPADLRLSRRQIGAVRCLSLHRQAVPAGGAGAGDRTLPRVMSRCSTMLPTHSPLRRHGWPDLPRASVAAKQDAPSVSPVLRTPARQCRLPTAAPLRGVPADRRADHG